MCKQIKVVKDMSKYNIENRALKCTGRQMTTLNFLTLKCVRFCIKMAYNLKFG